ncbi:MAG: hypothetical protein JWQ49_82 [Edaphobacter sp.]|nr:hypothetical protein [Edaphobacter sp.]
MISYQLYCIGYDRAILRFVLLPLVGLLYFCLPLDGQTIHEDNKSAALFGQVTQSGVPVASATVNAYEEVNNGSYIRLDGKCSSQTNNAGQYLCRGLSAGRYLLSVHMRGKSAQSASTAAIAFYYQTSNLADAELISVRDGQNELIEMELGSHPAFTVTGELLARPQSPALSLLAVGRHGETMPSGLSPSYDPVSGAFRFKGVPPGQYSLLALWHDSERAHSNEVAVTVTDQDVTALQVADAGTVHLAVELQPCEGGSAAVSQLSLKPADGHLTGGAQFALVSPGATNRFDFPDVPGGKYFVCLAGGKSAYIAGTSLAPQGAGNLISVPDGGGSITADVQMGCEASSLAGTVDTEDGIDRQAYVVLRSSLTGEMFQRNADADGKFVFSGIAPGEYRVYAVPASGQNNSQNSALIDETTGASVTLDPNKTTRIVVPLTQ